MFKLEAEHSVNHKYVSLMVSGIPLFIYFYAVPHFGKECFLVYHLPQAVFFFRNYVPSCLPSLPSLAFSSLASVHDVPTLMISTRLLRTASELTYALFVLILIVAIGLSCAALISQAIRTSPSRSWVDNANALYIGASYIIVLVASLSFCIKRRVAVRLKLQRISKAYRTISRDDLPKSVHRYIAQEYIRACLVSYESLPTDVVHEGWGRPGTKYSGMKFRRALLDTISHIDVLAHLVIPLHPKLKPHARMLHHFRFLLPLLKKDVDGMTLLHYYDSAIQLARNSAAELTEEEFEVSMSAAHEIEKCLNELRLEMLEEMKAQSNDY